MYFFFFYYLCTALCPAVVVLTFSTNKVVLRWVNWQISSSLFIAFLHRKEDCFLHACYDPSRTLLLQFNCILIICSVLHKHSKFNLVHSDHLLFCAPSHHLILCMCATLFQLCVTLILSVIVTQMKIISYFMENNTENQYIPILVSV